MRSEQSSANEKYIFTNIRIHFCSYYTKDGVNGGGKGEKTGEMLFGCIPFPANCPNVILQIRISGQVNAEGEFSSEIRK